MILLFIRGNILLDLVMSDSEIKASILIDLEIDSIHSFISRIENLVHYWPKVKEVELVSGDGRVGSTYKIYFPTLFNKRSIDIEVVKFESPFEFTFKNNSNPQKTITGFKLNQVQDGKTEVVIYKDSDNSTASKALSNSSLVSYFDSKKTTGEFEKILANLKKYLEDNKPPVASEVAPEEN